MERKPQTILPPIMEIKLGHHLAYLKNSIEPGGKWFKMGECLIGLGHGQAGWHMSISCKSRYPTWDEIAEAWYKLTPKDTPGAMLLPKPSDYVNISQFCLGIWEIEWEENYIQKVPSIIRDKGE